MDGSDDLRRLEGELAEARRKAAELGAAAARAERAERKAQTLEATLAEVRKKSGGRGSGLGPMLGAIVVFALMAGGVAYLFSPERQQHVAGARVAEAEAQLAQAEARAGESEARASEAERRAQSAEEHARAAEERAGRLEAELSRVRAAPAPAEPPAEVDPAAADPAAMLEAVRRLEAARAVAPPSLGGWAPVELAGVVRRATGETPVRARARCTVALSPGQGDCRARVRCGPTELYPSPGHGGYFSCRTDETGPIAGRDFNVTRASGDPMLDLDMPARRVTVADEDWEVEIALSAR